MKKHKRNLRILEILSITLGLFYLSPFYILLINAFKTKRELLVSTLSWPDPVTLANFPKAMEKMRFLRVFSNSLIISIGSILLLTIFPAMAAWVLVREKSRRSTLIFLLFVSAMLIPFQSVMLPLVQLMGWLNLLNKPLGLMFMYLGFGSSMAIFLYHGFIKSSIPVTLEEAAIIDGCNRGTIFVTVVLPLLKPISVTVAILNVIWIWNDYLLPSLVLQKRDARTIPLAISYFFGQFSSEWHLAMAALTLSILPVIIFYIFMQKNIIKGVTAGSLKM